jgi:hypothetical protein
VFAALFKDLKKFNSKTKPFVTCSIYWAWQLPQRSQTSKAAFHHHLSLSKSFGATCSTSSIMNYWQTDQKSRTWICKYSTRKYTYTLVDAWPVVKILTSAVLLPTTIILNSLHASLQTRKNG